ncbi:MAG: TlyA family RNA methyltransferase [Clostridia bacterium]|nr:TlyA family RNA methyltransferase [Clostridia bacterium]
MRLDVYLVENGLCRSRSRAAALIRQGLVTVDGKPAAKPSFNVADGMSVALTGDMRFVGRGGEKLQKAVEVFAIDLDGKTCVDVGASTGGFTDCMLRHGAAKVFAVDVGSGQLDASLAADSRVVNMENTNIRYLAPETVGRVDFAAADVSFISLSHVLPVLGTLLKPDGFAVCLVKPQFEAGRESVGKRGIVRNPRVHERVLRDVIDRARGQGLYPVGLDFSPIKGGDGNVEYLLFLSPLAERERAVDIITTVKNAHDAHGV